MQKSISSCVRTSAPSSTSPPKYLICTRELRDTPLPCTIAPSSRWTKINAPLHAPISMGRGVAHSTPCPLRSVAWLLREGPSGRPKSSKLAVDGYMLVTSSGLVPAHVCTKRPLDLSFCSVYDKKRSRRNDICIVSYLK